MAKIVKKCRRCGHTFEEKRLSPIQGTSIQRELRGAPLLRELPVEDEARGARVRPALFRRWRPRRHSGRRADCEVMGWKSRA